MQHLLEWHPLTHKAEFGPVKMQGENEGPYGATAWCSRKVKSEQGNNTSHSDCNFQDNLGVTSCTYVTNREKSKAIVKVWATDFCVHLSPGPLSLETTACCWLWRQGRRSHTHSGWTGNQVKPVTHKTRLMSKREEKKENKKVENYSLGSLPQAPSIHQLLLLCTVTKNTSPNRQSLWNSPVPVLECHLDSSVQTNPNSTPLTEILQSIRPIKICILQLLQFTLLLFLVLC